MAPGTDLLALTAELVDIGSVSHHERRLADHFERSLASSPHLEVIRIGDNVVARTSLGRSRRLLLAGHLDTVPANGNERARIDGDVCAGLGAADMKGGLAVMLDLARSVSVSASDVTYIWYVCEEVEQRYSGLRQIEAERPDLLAADAAILGEPTAGLVEAGCQGVLRIGVRLGGARAHTARPWMGVNAIHRLTPVLERLASFVERRPVIDGCEYREALQVVNVSGGVADNVVPDEARLVVNHRFAPDRTVAEAFDAIRTVFEPVLDASLGDAVELEDFALPAAPGLGHPLLSALVDRSGAPPRAKLGWTDVSFFAEHRVPAANFGPGEPTLAHTAGEWVDRAELERVRAALGAVVNTTG